MKNSKEAVGVRENVESVGIFLIIGVITTMLPFYIHFQWATGPIINALLIIALFVIGIRGALVLCLIPSLMALVGGLIPAILAPVVPFIMIANVIFVISIDAAYNYFKDSKKGYWTGVVIGAFLKFVFLFFSVSLISKIIIKQELLARIAQMMSWPQLATALCGGMLAWIFLIKIKNKTAFS